MPSSKVLCHGRFHTQLDYHTFNPKIRLGTLNILAILRSFVTSSPSLTVASLMPGSCKNQWAGQHAHTVVLYRKHFRFDLSSFLLYSRFLFVLRYFSCFFFQSRPRNNITTFQTLVASQLPPNRSILGKSIFRNFKFDKFFFR